MALTTNGVAEVFVYQVMVGPAGCLVVDYREGGTYSGRASTAQTTVRPVGLSVFSSGPHRFTFCKGIITKAERAS